MKKRPTARRNKVIVSEVRFPSVVNYIAEHENRTPWEGVSAIVLPKTAGTKLLKLKPKSNGSSSS